MAGEGLNKILDALDEDMLNNYNDYASECVEPWVNFKGNPGQLVIVKKYIIPAAVAHAEAARPNWPESATPEDYLNDLMNAYDPDVMVQAFGESIEEVYSNISEYWWYASGVQDEHFFIEGGGENAGPHSTWPVWRGRP